ncbi:orotidine-5'-phosphate decarboxylase [Cryobacterium arcticum]|uniref:Orotidine-5'-phosphate decarboxylase n=1 Tax=Cryobacterium arcticum TaxID=670052 RepID=A0A317ZP69_9MICO|nr:orotidine-5'-phosphate decarboxylase [Cryobacterium arcticum]PXA67698.1 orotidine-5'-phosphate decarboxylase [Cryobacterium arcticum]
MSPAEPVSTTGSFGERLQGAFDRFGRLCVGIDPHSWLLSDWNLPDSAAGAERFGRAVVAASAGQVGIVKPQVAFYERFGSAGYVALERVLADAREAGLLVIADVKRGDLGTSVEAYGQAWLTPGSPLEADAITLNPYMGVGSLASTVTWAAAHRKGLFLLSATSNPEAAELQQAVVAGGADAGKTVAASVLGQVAALNADAIHAQKAPVTFGSVGVVLGATVSLSDFGIDITAPASAIVTPVLAPGFGHQGANPTDLTSLFGGYAQGVIVSESRSVLSAGPDRVADEIARRVTENGATRG